MILEELKPPLPKEKYKRIIFGGVRDTLTFNTILHNNNSLFKEINDTGRFPCLVVWEQSNGDKHYTKVDTSEPRPAKTYKR